MNGHWLRKPTGWIFGIAVFLSVFTGFGNMPLWKRYYIADIPGLGWSGNFYANVNVHYVSGAILLGLFIYFFTNYLYLRKNGIHLTWSGIIRYILLGIVLITGMFMAIKNLSGVRFPFYFLVSMNLFHMMSAMFFAVAALISWIGRFQWVQVDTTNP
jgi:hypothetical protein